MRFLSADPRLTPETDYLNRVESATRKNDQRKESDWEERRFGVK
jgi:hypothetical protein